MNCKTKVIGFAVALSYFIVILGTWISSELHGVVYYSAGEPNRIILYTEWLLGFFAIMVIANEFKNGLDEIAKEIEQERAKVIYDHSV